MNKRTKGGVARVSKEKSLQLLFMFFIGNDLIYRLYDQ